jgi:hypothetical protein
MTSRSSGELGLGTTWDSPVSPMPSAEIVNTTTWPSAFCLTPNLLLGPSFKGKSFDLCYLDLINRNPTDCAPVRREADVADHCAEVIAAHNDIDHLM